MKIDIELLKDSREKSGLTKDEIATIIGVTADQYSDIECGERECSIHVLERISSIVNVKLWRCKTGKTEVISFFNAKGGVGKTTASMGLTSSLAERGYRVLCLDLDAQRNMTSTLLGSEYGGHNIYDVFSSENPFSEQLEEYIQPTRWEMIDIIAGSSKLERVTASLAYFSAKEFILQELLNVVISKSKYDYVIIDNGAHESLCLKNAIYASDYAIAPIDVSVKYSIDGIGMLFDVIKGCLTKNDRFKLLKLLINKYDKRVQDSDDYIEAIKDVYSNELLDNMIRIDISLEKAIKAGTTIHSFKPDSKAVEDFDGLADELVQLRG